MTRGRSSVVLGGAILTYDSKNSGGIMRITSKGQVTIPQAVREEAGLLPGTEVAFVIEGDAVRLIKTQGSDRPSRGERTVARLRRSAGNVSMSTDELMALTRGDG